MKQKLQKLINKTLKILKDEWIFALVILFLLTDVTHTYFVKKAYEENADLIQYQMLHAIVTSAETNTSVQSVPMSKLLHELTPTSKVYMIKEGKEKVSVLAMDGNKTMLVKQMPAISMTFTLESKLLEQNIAYEWVEQKEKPQPYIVKLLDVKYLNILLLAGMMYFLLYTSGIKLFEKEFSGISPKDIEGDFSDLVGYEDIKAEAKQLQYIITQKEKYAQYGIEDTFNILFSGKAGTGKSKFALYLAKELDVPIVSSTGSLDETYVGSGARKIRSLFAEANKLAQNSEHNTCILFIDEGQNLLRTRGRSDDHKWEDDTANELLAHLDGVEKDTNHNVIVIIASNFHEHSLEMDAAMLRRFKKKIHFREPNLEERKEILNHYLNKVEKKEENIDISYVAKNMSGMTPALIESVVQEAGLMALRLNSKINTALLLQAFERMVVGKSSRTLVEGKDSVRRAITVHEVGHFLVEYHRALKLSDGDKVKAKEITHILKISSESVEQIGALGFAMREQDDSRVLQTVEEMEWDIKQLYGGMAAEEMVYGKKGHTTGGADDIKKATRLLQHLVVENSVYTRSKLNYEMLGEQTNKIEEMENKSKIFYEETMDIVREYEGLLRYLSGVLMREWSLSKDEIFEHIIAFKV